MISKVYIYNDWHNSDLILTRPLIRAARAAGLDVLVGTYHDRAYLLKDLAPVVCCDLPEGSGWSLLTLCPGERRCVNAWFGVYKDLDETNGRNWSNLALTWNRQVGAAVGLQLDPDLTPMPACWALEDVSLPRLSVYVENGPVRSGRCHFEFRDMEAIGRAYPDVDFYCTANPNCNLPNVHNCASKNLIELAALSNACTAIVGKGSGPFMCTYTDRNRLKPRAVVGHRGAPFWEYDGNPLQYLEDMAGVHRFLQEAICAARAGAKAASPLEPAAES